MKTINSIKNRLFCFIVLFIPIVISAQEQGEDPLLYQSIIPTSKQSLLKDVDVIFNTRFSFNSKFENGDYEKSVFSVDQFRLEIRGKIHEKVSFRFRDRYTRAPKIGSQDNINRTTDIAALFIDFTPRTKFSMGKLLADLGGYEFDMNAIYILEYNDILDNSDHNLTGAGISHKLKDGRNTFMFQILDSRTNVLKEQYDNIVPDGTIESKTALAFVSNWHGTFFGGKFETSYSYGFFNEAKNTSMNYIALGNKFKSDKLLLYYDFKYSTEDLDRRGIVRKLVKSDDASKDVVYVENWLRAEYRVQPKVNLVLTLMSHSSYWNSNPDVNACNKLYTSYGLIPTVEYYPFKDLNLKFYLGYIARRYDYSSYAENAYGLEDKNTGRLSFGIIAPILVL
ncbi:porin [Flavobacterium sp. ZB4P13]|uniref:porin n=1 Tax=Flavobacterium sp. ZB4P13 TaxID=3401728 RepID=UPI003AAF10CE